MRNRGESPIAYIKSIQIWINRKNIVDRDEIRKYIHRNNMLRIVRKILEKKANRGEWSLDGNPSIRYVGVVILQGFSFTNSQGDRATIDVRYLRAGNSDHPVKVNQIVDEIDI